MADAGISPGHVAALLGNKFCHPCPVHHDLVNNSCNYLSGLPSTDTRSLVLLLPSKPPTSSRSTGAKGFTCEVVPAEDLHRLVDISGVQLYSINHRKVVFFNKRPSARCPLRGIRFYVRKFACVVCSRGLMEGAKVCSVACKVQAEAQTCYVHVQDESQVPSAMLNDEETSSTRYRSLYDIYLVRRKGRKVGTHPWCPDTGKLSEGVMQSHSLEKLQPASGRSRCKGQPVRAPFY
ncbi:hypothetical protein BS78_05G272200 [Paspalum vaginatum]|nr:hypothetical protein BS78_05G272200 [Paspalum vaginatum]